MNNEQEFYNLIKQYIKSDYSVSKANEFFNTLHKVGGVIFKDKRFSLKVENINKMWGMFKGVNYEFIDEEQQIKLNSFENYRNDLYRKALQLINYFHETTHEKQKDRYIVNNEKAVVDLDDYEKLMDLEILCNADAKLCNYEQQLIEIDAIHNSILEYKMLLDGNILPRNEQTLSVPLYACVRYFASINGEKHHVYYPKAFNMSSENLIGYYKEFYQNLKINNNNRVKTIQDIVDESDLSHAMRTELKNIDFEKIQEVIDTKTDEIYSVMENLYGELLNIYKPSDEMLKFFNTSYENFDNKVKSNNIVRMSALIFDDIHNKFSDKTTNKIGLTQQIKEGQIEF